MLHVCLWVTHACVGADPCDAHLLAQLCDGRGHAILAKDNVRIELDTQDVVRARAIVEVYNGA